MNSKNRASAFAFVLLTVISVFGQQTVVINDPTREQEWPKISQAERSVFDRDVWPVVSKKYEDESCTPETELSNPLLGSFSKPKADQTLVFFQVCQTGNGFGIAGLALLENGKVVGLYGADQAGWVVGARTLPDINQNGVNEFALYWSGGMHQGAGGMGVDVWEFSASALRGLGWFQAEGFSEDAPTFGYKVSVKKGKVPVFSRQKYLSGEDEKWRPSGRPVIFKLRKNVVAFAPIK